LLIQNSLSLANNLNRQLDEILIEVRKLRAGYESLAAANSKYEVQLSDLKVEADQYKQENIKLKKELEAKREVKNSKLSQSEDKSDSSGTDDKSGMKLQLDEFIKDIDQCIQIIQAK